MCIPVICTFPGKPGLSEVLPMLALGQPEHQWARATLPQEAQEKSCPAQCRGMAQPFPCSLHSRKTLGEVWPLATTALIRTQTLVSSVSHRKNVCSTRSFWTPQRSILEMEMTHSSLSGFLSIGTPYCTTSSQVTTQPLPWPAIRRECRGQPTLSKIRSCPFLWLPPNQISWWLIFFIAENTHHWIHSVLMTYTLQRGCCSKNNRTDSSSNICSPASHFLSLNSGAVKMCSSCTFPQSSLYWPLLEASWAAGGQIRPTRARLLSIPLSLHPSLTMLQPWRTAFYSFFFFNSSKRKKITFLKVFPFAVEKG